MYIYTHICVYVYAFKHTYKQQSQLPLSRKGGSSNPTSPLRIHRSGPVSPSDSPGGPLQYLSSESEPDVKIAAVSVGCEDKAAATPSVLHF